MREQLNQYVNLLFAGAPDADEIRAEILQNTLDRYDDLVGQGKSPEAAYRLAIGGIGDINEILGVACQNPAFSIPAKDIMPETETEDYIRRKKTRAIAIAMYILCALPLIILGDLGLDNLGLCLTLVIVACATYLIITTGRKSKEDDEIEDNDQHRDTEKNPLKESIGNSIWIAGLIAYFGLSFLSGAWHITWLIFPITACACGLSDAIIDLMEVNKHEN